MSCYYFVFYKGLQYCTYVFFKDLLPYIQGRGVHVTGVSAAYTFKLNKNILSE
jgi:hypothetical protein